jgi:hypothetical protein
MHAKYKSAFATTTLDVKSIGTTLGRASAFKIRFDEDEDADDNVLLVGERLIRLFDCFEIGVDANDDDDDDDADEGVRTSLGEAANIKTVEFDGLLFNFGFGDAIDKCVVEEEEEDEDEDEEDGTPDVTEDESEGELYVLKIFAAATSIFRFASAMRAAVSSDVDCEEPAAVVVVDVAMAEEAVDLF